MQGKVLGLITAVTLSIVNDPEKWYVRVRVNRIPPGSQTWVSVL